MVLLIILSGFLYPLIFPNFNFTFLFPVVFIGLILYSLQTKKSIKNIFIFGWLAGIICNIIMLYWIYWTLIWVDAGFITSIIALIFLSAYLGLYWGIFSVSVFLIEKYNIKFKILIISSVWVLLEFLRGWVFIGFPWLLVGYSVWNIPEFIQIASYTGIWGLSFFVIFINTAIAYSLKLKKIMPFITAVVLAGFLFIWGTIVMPDEDIPARDLKVSILQGNIAQHQKWDSYFREEILDTYRELHSRAINEKAELIVWPETALPAALTRDIAIYNYIQELVENTSAYMLIGSNEIGRGELFNSAYLVSPAGMVSEPYRKIHLVPFGEYIPMRWLLSPFFSVMNEFGDFNAGDEYILLNMGEFRIAVGICFESVFSSHARNFFKSGANIYVNITNDGWFLDTAAPRQHLIHSVIRAVENRTYVIRAANTGISAIISPSGRILKETELLETTVLSGRVGKSSKTFYTKYGDVFLLVCFLFMIYTLWRSKKCWTNIKKKLKI